MNLRGSRKYVQHSLHYSQHQYLQSVDYSAYDILEVLMKLNFLCPDYVAKDPDSRHP